MAYTPANDLIAGTYVDENDWNRLVDNIAFLANPPACLVKRSTTQSYTDTVIAACVFDTEIYDTDSMHSTASLQSRININTAGIYTFSFIGEFQASVSADYVAIWVDCLVNSATVIGAPIHCERNNTNVYGEGVFGVWTFKMAVGDYVEFRPFQDGTGSKNLLAGAIGTATWIGLG